MSCTPLFIDSCLLGLGAGRFLKPCAYVEKDDDCVQVLRSRIDDGLLPAAAIHRDVATYVPPADTLACGAGGGFPCQGVSTAGNQAGLKDSRTSLVCHIFRVFDALPGSQRQVRRLQLAVSV